MAKKEESFVTPEFTLYFPELADRNQMSNKYRVVAVFDEDTDLTALKDAMKTAAVNKWGSKVPADLRNPLRTPEQEKTPEIWPEGTLHCALITTWDPMLVDRDHNKSIPASKFYPGCRCRAVIHVWAYDAVGQNSAGLTLTLDMLQFVSDGERLGGGAGASKELLHKSPLAELPTKSLLSDSGEKGGPLDFG